MTSANDSSLDKSIQGAWRMQVETHRWNARLNQRPYQGTPFGVNYSTTNRYRESEAVESLHRVPWGCWLWLPASHALGQHTCTEHPLWARRGARVTTAGVPRIGSLGFPRSLQGARRAAHTSLVGRNLGSRWHFKVKAWVPQLADSPPPQNLRKGQVSPREATTRIPRTPHLL